MQSDLPDSNQIRQAAPPIALLLVDDDDDFRGTVARRFVRRGFRVQEASSGADALALCQRQSFDVVVLDLMMPGMSGIEALERLKKSQAEVEVVMLTGQGTIETAVQAMKLGAFDYLTKPFPLVELELLIQRAYERRRSRKGQPPRAAAGEPRDPSDSAMIGRSTAMQQVFRLIERAGPSERAILIQGESGTGKELVARALHCHHARAERPLVVINCAALPETLLESELFGFEKGAFTGAVAAKPGLFEIADGGTLLIDEIGELAGGLQAKLLRVLEDGSLRRVGAVKEQRVNVRLLAATNRNLADEVQAGRFREDLYYRINVMSLELPPLRDRPGDIPLLVEHFLGADWRIAPVALRAVERYPWPGNVRQLINAIERAKIMAEGETIELDDLPPEVGAGAADTQVAASADPAELSAVQRAHVVEVLNRERGNKARTARSLGIDRRSLYRLLDKFDIRVEKEGPGEFS